MIASRSHYYSLAPGEQLFEYQISGVLGHGGFGITYLAHDENLNQDVAIKEYLPNELALRDSTKTVRAKSSDDEETFRWGLEAFLKEARNIARCRHPNIMQVRRYFQANGTAYLVMDFEEGETLDLLLGRHGGTLDQETLLPILAGLLDGLAVVHTAGILHRDIKPGNIIIRPDQSPVLIDFGAAREFRTRFSRSITAIVSAGYAPIEQYGSTSAQGPWTDLYAVGAVAYRAISGKAPVEAIQRLRHDPLIPATRLARSHFDCSFLAAIDWALRTDETERPQSAAELRASLVGSRHVVTDKPTARRLPGSLGWIGLGGAAIAAIAAGGYLWIDHTAVMLPTPATAPAPAKIVVDANGDGGVKTIAEAVEQIAAGGEVRVHAGTYRESLTITKDLTLEGDADATLIATGGPCVILRAEHATIRRLAMRNGGTGVCIAIEGGGSTIEDSPVASDNDTAIAVTASAHPTLRHLFITARIYGISIAGGAGGVYSENQIIGTGDAAIRVSSDGGALITNSTIETPGGAGILASGGHDTLLKGNRIVGAALSGIEVAGASGLAVSENEIVDGKQAALYIHSDGRALVADNVFRGQSLSQIVVEGATSSRFLRNHIENGRANGVYVTQGGTGEFLENTVADNAGSGFIVDLNSTPVISNNLITGNIDLPVRQSDSAHAVVSDNRLVR
jgi:nitrous oxidase accessory protein NosD